MRKFALLAILISGTLFVSGCDSIFGPHIIFTNTSGVNSPSLVIYDSSGNTYMTLGVVNNGASTTSEYIAPGDYYVAADIGTGPTRCIFDSFTIKDSNDYTGTYYTIVLNGTASYGCNVSQN